MPNEKKPRRTPEELWKALEELSAEDEMDQICALTDEELDAELRANGADPQAIRERGAAFANMLLERRERETPAANAIEGPRDRLAKRAVRRGTLSEAELRARIELVRNDPRLKIAVGFRNRDTAAATVPELEALLEEMEEVLDGEGSGTPKAD